MTKDPAIRGKGRGKSCAGLSPVRAVVVGREPAHLFAPAPGCPAFAPARPNLQAGPCTKAPLSGWWCGAGAASPPGAPRGHGPASLSLRQMPGTEVSKTRCPGRGQPGIRGPAWRGRKGRGLVGGGAGRLDGHADWLQARCTGRAADAPLHRAAPHAEFTCRFPILPCAAGSARGCGVRPALPARASSVLPLPVAVFVFLAKDFFPQGLGAAGRAL